MTSTASNVMHPLVQWAQRDTLIYLTIEVDTITDLKLTAKSLHVKGTYSDEKTVYEATLEFYGDVKPDYRKIGSDRHLELVISKETAGWWPRLLTNAVKPAWVKVDFNKWKDEDDEEEEVMGGDFDFQNYMSKMNTGGGDGVPNLDGFDGAGSDDEDDDDNGDMPDLEDADDEGSEKKEESEDVITGKEVPKTEGKKEITQET